MVNKLIIQFVLLATLSFMCKPFVGVSTFAGSLSKGDGLTAAETKLDNAYAITFNTKTGDFYMTDARSVRKTSSTTNIMTTIAGKSSTEDPGDGQPATNTPLVSPRGLAISSNGDVYISDYDTCKIKKISADGIMTTVAGTGPGKNNDRSVSGGFIGDGALANETELAFPYSIAFHPITGELHIAETNTYKIRKINKFGRVETVAGTGSYGFSGDGGLAVNAKLGIPSYFMFDSIGNMYLSDKSNYRVRMVLTNGTIITVAGNGMKDSNTDGLLAVDASINIPSGLALSSTGELYIAESNGHRIRKVLTNGTITTVAGTGVTGFGGDGGLAVDALLYSPQSLFIYSNNLYISDYQNQKIRKVSLSDGTISTFAGDGFGDGKSATVYGVLKYPQDIKKTPNGNFLIVDTGNLRIRSVSKDGIITTISGSSDRVVDQVRSLRELSKKTTLLNPLAITTSSNGDIYFTDKHKIYKISNQDGTISTIIGTGESGFSPDGSLAQGSAIADAYGLAFNSLGELVFSERTFNRIRKILTNGTLVTVAGSGTIENSAQGSGGDGGPASEATLNTPGRLFIKSDNIYFVDVGNFKVRCISSDGTISTVAGSGNNGYGDDGILATETSFDELRDVSMNSKGELIIADDSRIRKVDNNGIIQTIAGKGAMDIPYGDGGPAYDASFKQLGGIYVDSNDDIYLSDIVHMRIRKISLMCPSLYTLNGSECIPTCNGIAANDPAVCSGRGVCNETNTCLCNSTTYGANCELFNCSGISSNSNQVCSSHGTCASPEVCNCESGYLGKNCEMFNCFNINYQNSTVCSSQGNCTAPNKCSCKSGYLGTSCESFTCKGIKNSDSSVCSSRGQCISPDTCKCTTVNSYGANCELMMVLEKSSNITATKSVRLNDGVSIKASLLLVLVILVSIFIQ